MIRFPWGDLQVTVLDAGTIWLDGGAMFGVVPKVLWQQRHEPDERNRIRLAMNLLLVENGKGRTLIDTGAGSAWSDKELDIYGLDPKTPEEILAPAGLLPEQIDRVINTHLHFDHAGGNTVDGGRTAAYPNAEYLVQKGEIDTARSDNERSRGSYRTDCFESLIEQRRLRPVEGETVLDDGLRLLPAPGHTPHMQLVLIPAGGQTLAFLADLVPTAAHLPYPYIMGFDLEPLRTLDTKKRVLRQAAAEGWRVVFEHDHRTPVAQLVEGTRGVEARPLELEA